MLTWLLWSIFLEENCGVRCQLELPIQHPNPTATGSWWCQLCHSPADCYWQHHHPTSSSTWPVTSCMIYAVSKHSFWEILGYISSSSNTADVEACDEVSIAAVLVWWDSPHTCNIVLVTRSSTKICQVELLWTSQACMTRLLLQICNDATTRRMKKVQELTVDCLPACLTVWLTDYTLVAIWAAVTSPIR